eukprot:3341503-Amphidinium_carterae.1
MEGRLRGKRLESRHCHMGTNITAFNAQLMQFHCSSDSREKASFLQLEIKKENKWTPGKRFIWQSHNVIEALRLSSTLETKLFCGSKVAFSSVYWSRESAIQR